MHTDYGFKRRHGHVEDSKSSKSVAPKLQTFHERNRSPSFGIVFVSQALAHRSAY
ncbi:MAG: hypothetical protein JWP89_2039 [Schlesneria sp.]|nr:hypothetical protein [Schlesneria sp.]